MDWPFPDDPDVVVLTSRGVVDDGDWVHYVSHDEDDGAWQFHGHKGVPDSDADARVVLLRNMLKIDSTLGALGDLPTGWIARRDSADGPWERRRR